MTLNAERCFIRVGSDSQVYVGKLAMLRDSGLLWSPESTFLWPARSEVRIPWAAIRSCHVARRRENLRRPLLVETTGGDFRFYFNDWLIGEPSKQLDWEEAINKRIGGLDRSADTRVGIEPSPTTAANWTNGLVTTVSVGLLALVTLQALNAIEPWTWPGALLVVAAPALVILAWGLMLKLR
jgi:hypothetical protein